PTRRVRIPPPDAPAPVRTFGRAFHSPSLVDGYLYGNGSAGVMIYDPAAPENPAFVGQYAPYYVHDVLVRGDTMYTAGIYGEGIDIVDISDRAARSWTRRSNYPGAGCHSYSPNPSGTYLYR